MSELYLRLSRLREGIAEACAKAGRDPSEIRLLGASKGQSPERIAEASSEGVKLFGENKIQEAIQKIPRCPGGIEWHFIGHLQSNKIRPAVQAFSAIHSVDSWDLAEGLEKEAEKQGCQLDVFVEVNVSGERSKFGVSPDAAPELVARINGLSRLRATGLMTMAPFLQDPMGARPFFARLRDCREGIRQKLGLEVPELSMGMSHDYRAAILEGATIIRIGTALFGERRSPNRTEAE